MAAMHLPVEHLFTLRLDGLLANRHDYAGAFGRRILAKALSGTARGPRFNGTVLPLHATDYGRASTDGTIRQLEADIGIELDDGTTVLMQYRGRMAPRYGTGGARIQVGFEVEPGPHGWLNAVQAIGIGEERADGSTVFEIYALTGAAPGEGDPAPAGLPADYIFSRKSEHVPGGKRYKVMGPLGARYFTLAEGGGKFTGPQLSGEFLSGFSWSPHRTDVRSGDGTPGPDALWRFDVKTLLREDDGTPILMSYTGVAAPHYEPGSWVTAILFEAPEGPHGWLNEVQAIGFGRWAGDGAHYNVYALS